LSLQLIKIGDNKLHFIYENLIRWQSWFTFTARILAFYLDESFGKIIQKLSIIEIHLIAVLL